MPILLQLKDAQKHYGTQVLLNGADVALTDEHKVGLIGRNGSGKSTLCRVLIGQEDLDSGELIRHPDLRLGYLTQHDPFQPGESVLDFLMRDSGQPEWRCGEVAWQFELKGPYLERPVTQLSGGWQTRIKLASLLLHDPNFLILDEPTNFLDLRTQLLLERFLKDFRGACLVVSHDRTFLGDTCTQTLELSRGKLTLFPGAVESYLAYRQEQREHDERVNSTILSKRRQLETFIAKNRAGANTASQARSKAKVLEKLQLVEVERDEARVRLRVPEIQPRKGTALACKDLSIGYPDRLVAGQIELDSDYGARVAVVGDNGQGKTTFLRTLAGTLPALSGQVRWGYECSVGIYAQHVYGSLEPELSVEEYLQREAAPGLNGQVVLRVAGSFLFQGDDVRKKIGVLSGGERARLCLAGLLLGQHSVLILDEPVNHLDVETVEVLATGLKQYRGTLFFTSHDRHFMARVATSVIEVRDGKVTKYPGDYEHYLYRINKEIDEGARPAQTKAAPGRPRLEDEQSRAERKELARQRFELERELKSCERRLERWGARKKEILELLPTLSEPAEADRLARELTEVEKRLEEIEVQWFDLHEEQERLARKTAKLDEERA